MSETSTDDVDEDPTVGPDPTGYDRYAAVSLADGELLLYDRDEEDAWLQSDAPVDLETAV